MNISLTPELEKMIYAKVDTGLYNSASEVIREALRLLFEKDIVYRQQLNQLNKDIEEGLEAANKGQLSPGKEVYKRLKDRSKES